MGDALGHIRLDFCTILRNTSWTEGRKSGLCLGRALTSVPRTFVAIGASVPHQITGTRFSSSMAGSTAKTRFEAS